ncbi:MAG TPA: hypothetical protein VGL56_19990 [Fimbriimonadaceae bacterium]
MSVNTPGGGTGTVSTEPIQPSVEQFGLTDNPKTKEAKDTFAPDTAKIYAEMNLEGTNEGDRVKTAFVCDSAIDPANKKAIKNLTIASVPVNLKVGMKSVEASLSKPTNGWPIGEYHVDVYINDKFVKTAKFTVAAQS